MLPVTKTILAIIVCSCIGYSCARRPAATGQKQGVLFDRQGHRGARGLMPENTLPAMLHAVDLGVTTLEMDVHITADSQVVLSHDPWMNATIATPPDGSLLAADDRSYILYRMTYDSIQQFDVGTKPHPQFPEQQKMRVAKPLLTQLADSVESYCRQKNRRVWYNIEIKSSPAGDGIYHPAPAQYVDLVVAAVRQKNIADRVIIQSFDVRPLQYLHTRYPQLPTAMLVDGSDQRSFETILQDLGFKPAIYSPHYTLVTSSLVQQCHRLQIRVVPWTVNDLPTMKALKKMGVDGLISDYPNLYNQL